MIDYHRDYRVFKSLMILFRRYYATHNSFLSNLEIQDFFPQYLFISSNFSFSFFDNFRRRHDDRSFGPCF